MSVNQSLTVGTRALQHVQVETVVAFDPWGCDCDRVCGAADLFAGSGRRDLHLRRLYWPWDSSDRHLRDCQPALERGQRRRHGFACRRRRVREHAGGAALTWDLPGNPGVTITKLDTADFAVSHDGTSTEDLGGIGTWLYEIDCTVAGCSHGASHPNSGPLTFTIGNITTSGFIINNKASNGYIFVTDICTQRGAESGCSGITADGVASDTPAPSPISEPAVCILGVAMLGSGTLLRRQN